MKMVTEFTMTINASAETRSMSSKITVTFSGKNINTWWSIIKEEFNDEDGDVIINDSNHSVTMIQAIPSESISLSEIDGF